MTYASLHSNIKKYQNIRRKLRLNPTKAEEVLWKELRNKKLGYKFRRQFQIDNYIVDFCCRELRLVIELDGPIHEYQREYDESRTKDLEKVGLLVLRYTNDRVLFDRDTILSELRVICDKRTSNLQPPTPP